MNPFEALKARLEAPVKGPKIRNARDEGLQEIADRLNADRKLKGYKPWPMGKIASELSHVRDLHALHKHCCTDWRIYNACYNKYKLTTKNHAKATNQEADPGPATGRPGSQGPAQAQGSSQAR